jgi:hypothetical protein
MTSDGGGMDVRTRQLTLLGTALLLLGIGVSFSMVKGFQAFGGILIGITAIITVLAGYSRTLGQPQPGAKVTKATAVGDRALAFAFGFSMFALGLVIALTITFGTFDISLLLLTIVFLLTAAYTGITLWRRFTMIGNTDPEM